MFELGSLGLHAIHLKCALLWTIVTKCTHFVTIAWLCGLGFFLMWLLLLPLPLPQPLLWLWPWVTTVKIVAQSSLNVLFFHVCHFLSRTMSMCHLRKGTSPGFQWSPSYDGREWYPPPLSIMEPIHLCLVHTPSGHLTQNLLRLFFSFLLSLRPLVHWLTTTHWLPSLCFPRMPYT